MHERGELALPTLEHLLGAAHDPRIRLPSGGRAAGPSVSNEGSKPRGPPIPGSAPAAHHLGNSVTAGHLVYFTHVFAQVNGFILAQRSAAD